MHTTVVDIDIHWEVKRPRGPGPCGPRALLVHFLQCVREQQYVYMPVSNKGAGPGRSTGLQCPQHYHNIDPLLGIHRQYAYRNNTEDKPAQRTDTRGWFT